jgi:hypothetical protein
MITIVCISIILFAGALTEIIVDKIHYKARYEWGVDFE